MAQPYDIPEKLIERRVAYFIFTKNSPKYALSKMASMMKLQRNMYDAAQQKTFTLFARIIDLEIVLTWKKTLRTKMMDT